MIWRLITFSTSMPRCYIEGVRRRAEAAHDITGVYFGSSLILDLWMTCHIDLPNVSILRTIKWTHRATVSADPLHIPREPVSLG